jgi:hypothetical protein
VRVVGTRGVLDSGGGVDAFNDAIAGYIEVTAVFQG